MQLKKLHLLGFKTFADKTEIAIGEGLTAIVGPNGSGKSNLVDAILWVLGEQNPRLLRGERAQDVIFNGSDRRKPLGMAEVRLLLDNTDGSLPLPFSEVSVARRIYRSGESQYLINGAPCRLKDVVELFLDTGAGRGAYAVVGQQEVDAVLSARPEDRRELFEEAAGIKKYRVKKREALRKLEVAETNLQRVRDILRELEAQREPLERQAVVARRYLGFQERLRELEVGLLVAEVQRADYELYGLRQEQEADRKAILQLEAQQAHLEQNTQAIAQRLAQAERDLEAARQNRQNLLSQLERVQSGVAVLDERIRATSRTLEQANQELEELEAQKKELELALALHEEEIQKLQEAISQQERAWAAECAALKELDQVVTECLHALEELRSQRVRRAEERAKRTAALQTAQERLAETQKRLRELEEESKKLKELQEESRTRLQQLEVEQKSNLSQRQELLLSLDELEAQRKALQAEVSACYSQLEAARRALSEQASRLSTLIELQESYDGFYHGVRALLQAVRRGTLKGSYQPVVDLLTVPERYRVAIEVALGSSLQDIVTLTEEEAKAGIAWLKQNRAGRVTFLPLSLLRPGPPLARFSEEPGVEGIASELVSFATEHTKVAQLLLGRVVVVNDLDKAIALSKKLNGWSRIVTLEGELLTPGGALTGGSLQGRGAHLVGRKGEIDDLKNLLPIMEAEERRLAQRYQELAEKQQGISQEIDQRRRALANCDQALAATSTAQSAAQRELHRLQEQVEALHKEEQTTHAYLSQLEEELEQLARLILTGEEDDTDAENTFALLQQEAETHISRRDMLRSQVARTEVLSSSLKAQRDGLLRSRAEMHASLEDLGRRIQQRMAQHRQAQMEEVQAQEEKEALTQRLVELKAQLQAAEKHVAQAETIRQQQLDKSLEGNNALREVAQTRQEITTRLHETELRVARLEMQLAQAAERLQQEYNIPLEEALEKHVVEEMDDTVVREVSRLRRELRAMGHVNTGAIEEFERLTERCEFLSSQQTDLEKSRQHLLATIEEIDSSTRDIFLETFEAIRLEFDNLFKRLFGGGQAKLLLTDPADILETGIDIIVQPPGKKAQSLALLSGGERALTATALLFAFLKVRPSPFVILDEVDAPLDGANVEKFVQLVREFSARSQFLIITHNPVTMEAAPIWYGVTMREPGVSTIVSYRVPEETAQAEETHHSVGSAT